MITINDLNKSENFFLMAGPCVIEGEDMALRIAEKIVGITERLHIPYVFKGSYRKANRSRLDSFTGIGDEKALKILRKVGESSIFPPLPTSMRQRKLPWPPNMSISFKSRLSYAAKRIYW